MYISQDPIGLWGIQLILYSYVSNPNLWVDTLGLVGGGTYQKVRKTNIGGEVHHMPANSINGLSYGSCPAIWMETVDHQRTASYGSGLQAAAYRRTQQQLIQKGKFGKAMEMDICDIKSKFGNKYNASMVEAIEEAKSQGLIKDDEGKRLKKMCNS
jgi:uncharacterized protein RhaS with RHS repeats